MSLFEQSGEVIRRRKSLKSGESGEIVHHILGRLLHALLGCCVGTCVTCLICISNSLRSTRALVRRAKSDSAAAVQEENSLLAAMPAYLLNRYNGPTVLQRCPTCTLLTRSVCVRQCVYPTSRVRFYAYLCIRA